MRILWISPVCPWPPTDGNRQRNFYLLRAVARDHEVTLVCPVTELEGGQLSVLRGLCTVMAVPAIDGASGSLRTGPLRRLAAGARRLPDCIVPASIGRLAAEAERLCQEQSFDLAFGGVYVAPALDGCRGHAPVVLDSQNAEGDLYRQFATAEPWGARKLARFLDWRAVAAYERRWMPSADAVTLCSSRDAERLRSQLALPERRYIVPNGADTRDGGPVVERDRARLVFVGGMSYLPNVDGARFLVNEIMPLIWRRCPSVHVDLVGKDPAAEVRALSGPRVKVTGAVPSVHPYLGRATVAIVPLRMGGGTRLKVLEAMAIGTPVVSTRLGVEGLDIDPGRDALISDSAEGLADAVVRLLSDAEAASKIALAARERAAAYSWDRIGTGFVDALSEVVGSKTSVA